MDPREIAHGFRMAAIAVVSAVLTASIVIGVGHGLTRSDTARAAAVVLTPASY